MIGRILPPAGGRAGVRPPPGGEPAEIVRGSLMVVVPDGRGGVEGDARGPADRRA
ncbi:hypothetical protein SAV14893_003230 [Streptomyces avermitilis]|uniref:Uncharacterized protein n=1 Tax=Streptomyces avermitilis TaxID=33903 RepID=A0A4D4N3B1_STRAX|nr:hypothetical protein SAVMC3_15130 [Streptomyces avermitilis]GDY60930.1 hypothetical protein SAV14893_003230 [Streptomyces avermitilis]GDY78998.1 hypothetical protein SAV31267_084830 [Streptomyces avermitilis]GDY88163.1 hypothetical protein SAVCW2_73620 [Streptomyces avermitilis]